MGLLKDRTSIYQRLELLYTPEAEVCLTYFAFCENCIL